MLMYMLNTSLFVALQETCGWYYLLAEELGRSKHLQVSQEDLHASTDSIHSLHSHHKVRLERQNSSWGFTVTGADPVLIGRIQNDSPAEAAGLQRGDQIVSVNGLQVSRSPAATVAQMIK